MKERVDYYSNYEKLKKKRFEGPITEASEYKVIAEHYPHIAESIRLKQQIEKLKEKLMTSEERSTIFQTKREIFSFKMSLKRENVLKRVYKENKKENTFRIRLTSATIIEHISPITKKVNTTTRKMYTNLRKSVDKAYISIHNKPRTAYKDLQKTYRGSRISLRRLMHRKLLPSIFDLKSLDVDEKNIAVSEWMQAQKIKSSTTSERTLKPFRLSKKKVAG